MDDDLALRHSLLRADFAADLVVMSWSLSLLLLVTFTFLFGVLLAELGMARGIPRPSFLEVPDLFLLLDSPRNIFYHSSGPRVLAKIGRGPRNY